MSGLISKELRPLYKAAKAAGWRERKSKSGVVLYPPNGARPVSFHGTTASHGRILENCRKQLRAGGLDV